MPPSKSSQPQHLFEFLLVLHLAALAGITFIAYVASSARAGCVESSPANSIIDSVEIAPGCTMFERISSFLIHNAPYFQAIHAHLAQNIITLALLVFKPCLTAMVWSALESKTLMLKNFRRSLDLVNSPGFMYIMNYMMKDPPPLSFPVFFVIASSILSQLSTFGVSPIYRPHHGPYSTTATIVYGGGVDSNITLAFNSFTVASPRGVTIGKTLVSGMALANISVPTSNIYSDLLPFIPPKTIKAIWKGTVHTVIAQSSLDCSSSAATDLVGNNTAALLVVDSSTYFDPSGIASWANPHPSFAGYNFGALGNDAQLIAVYLNGSYVVGQGSVTGQASVIFAAANGTMEGAQYTVYSPNPTSRIKSIDILVCTSSTQLVVSTCTITLGNVTSCVPSDPQSIPSSSSMGGVDTFVERPADVAITLAVAPVIAIPYWYNDVPSYDVSPDIIANRVLPLPYLTLGESRLQYSIPLSYVKDVLFAQTARFMVQGMVSDVNLHKRAAYQITLFATFGTSNPTLIFIIVALGFLIGFIAIIGSKIAGKASTLDAILLLSISKSAKLTQLLDECVERPDRLDKTVTYDDRHNRLVMTSEVERATGTDRQPLRG